MADNTGRGRATLLVVVVAAAVLVVDQLSKIWAVAALENEPPVQVIGDFFRLVFVRNSGAAFSLGSGSTIVVSLLALVIVGVLIYRARNLQSVWWAIAMGGMIGGALGNLTDRVFREPGVLRGHVVDFFALPIWPVFNVADIAVVGSAIGMVVLALLGIDFDGTRHGRESAESTSAPGSSP